MPSATPRSVPHWVHASWSRMSSSRIARMSLRRERVGCVRLYQCSALGAADAAHARTVELLPIALQPHLRRGKMPGATVRVVARKAESCRETAAPGGRSCGAGRGIARPRVLHGGVGGQPAGVTHG